MAIATVEMKAGYSESRAAFAEYRMAVRRRQNEDDEALMRAYSALARGGRVLDLVATVRAVGADEQGRPRLAVCRADAEIVFCRVLTGGAVIFALTDGWRGRKNEARSARVRLPVGTLQNPRQQEIACRARVPMIPPRLRPAGDVGRYHILWEAEWVNVPKDPILLRHLGRSFYAVVAQWDLTPLEQAILGAKGPA